MIKIIGQLLIWAALLLSSEPVLAYLDPGTGSMMLQVILGGIAAVGVALKLYWHKLRVALGFRGKDKPENEFN
ncbi:MAG: hypothetical protein OES53_03035 [Xanthomonadales bacterium]|jgi:hypothetical protein|nr:hypothetical protein [Xanthomonadales bacterium]MDH3925029.1 hypothetical protein [Xanthomonadales bacterium]MDH3939821.1 hypothetical protein [Xanthomonadales bacterium]MDH4001788.1 hypothetical protein [Xanthomonadales bacterium]